MQKYIGDKWYKENDKKLIENLNLGIGRELHYENATRLFQVLDEFIKNGYTLEELGAMRWLYELLDYLKSIRENYDKNYDKWLGHFLKLLNYTKEHGLNLNERLRNRKYEFVPILDEPLSDLHWKKRQLKSYEEEHPNWASDESSSHQNYVDKVKKSETIVNALLEHGANTVSAKYRTEVEELGLADKITVATD